MLELRLRIKALFLLLSFLGVHIISMSCTIINLAHEYAHSKIATEENHPNHSHHQHHSHDSNAIANTETDSEKESCCIENSSIFLSGIEAIPVSIPYTLIPSSSYSNFFLNSKIESVPTFKSMTIEIRPPPLLDVYSSLLRIVIQSLQV